MLRQIFLAAGIFLLPAAALAQDPGQTATVDLSSVRLDAAQQLAVDPSQVPNTIEAPVDVAAKACGRDAADLASHAAAKDGSACVATSTNADLNREIQKQLKK